jgi:hypothetical protein
MSSPTNSTSSNIDYNADIMSTVNKLQAIETDLYSDLENASISNDLAKQTDIKSKIASVSNTRIQLLNSLNNIHTMTQAQVINNRDTLLNNLVSQGVISTELSNLKSNLDLLESNKNDKLKMVQINTYYAKRYKAHSELMKSVFMICAVILLVVILDKKGFLPNNVGPLAVIIILVASIIFIARKVYDLNRRDNLDFDRYKWKKMDSKTYDYNARFDRFNLDKFKIDTSLCDISNQISDAAKSAGKAISGAANTALNNYGATSGGSRITTPGSTEGFDILAKHYSPASYP